MSNTATGIVHKIFPTVEISDKFKKRDLILKLQDGQYEQYIKFEFHQDRVSVLDNFNAGEEVTVSYNLRGREWKEKFFTTLVAWRIQLAEAQGAAPAPPPANGITPKYDPPSDNEDLPF